MKQLLERIENMMGSARVDCYRLHHDKKHQHSNSKPCLALIEWEKTLFELKAAIDNWTEEPVSDTKEIHHSFIQPGASDEPYIVLHGWLEPNDRIALYTHPAPHQGLTDLEIFELVQNSKNVEGNNMLPFAFAREVEKRILGETNEKTT